ncbi:MAG TPA: sodium:solute symporter family protein [Gemmatimonadaceae bacterium]
MTPALAALVVYLVLQLGIGVWASRRIASEADYLVAGRRLGPALATFSIFATWFGSETIVGSAGTAWRDGASLASAEPFGYGLCLVLMGLVFARPLWRRGLTTLADLFRQRYSIRVERVAAVILIPGSLLWAAAQVRAFGHVLATVAPALPMNTAIAVAAGFVMLYTIFGGLLADAVTDLLQGVVLTTGLVMILIATLLVAPEGAPVVNDLEASGALRMVPHDVSLLDLLEEWSIPVFGSVIAAELVGRVIATRSERVASWSSVAAGGLYLVVGLIPVVVGLLARGLVPELADAEQIMPVVAQRYLPLVLHAVFAGALVSAILSTVDSTLLISAGILSHNVIVPMARVTVESTKVRIARVGVLTFAVVAYVLAVRAEGVFALVEQASAFGSAGILVTASFGLFTRWGGPRTALVTLIGSLGAYLVASYGGAATPYLISLGVAVVLYGGLGLVERK